MKHTTNLRSICCVLFAIVATTFVHATSASAEQRNPPNIILCMADDLGWGDTGFNGHPHIKTPNLDQMAAAGARLDRFYVGSPLCVPSRAGLLTGRIAIRCGISNHRGAVSHLRAEEFTIAELAKSKGYTTGHFGKWHLGMLTPDYEGDKSVLMTPGMAGFDEWFASPSSVATHDPYTDPGAIGRALGGKASPQPIDLRAGYIHSGKPLDEPVEGCAAEIVMDRAIPFIRNAAKTKQPFLTVIWFNPPHTPVVGHPKYMNELYSHLPENQQHYYSLATAIDAQMGRLRQELRDLGIDDDTMLAFTSDNGPGPPIGRTRKPEARLQGSAGPFRERKASLYEGGIREPGLIEWPSQIQPGTVVKTPCTTLDYMPTLAKLLDIELPDRPYDGMDIMPILKGEQPERGKPIAFYFRDAVALSGERYKLVAAQQTKGKRAGGAVSFTNKQFELFDLDNDRGETTDVAADHPRLVTEMKAQLVQWVDSLEQSRLGKDYEWSKVPATSTVPKSPTAAKRTHLFLCSGQSNMKNLDLNVSFTPTLKKAFPEDEVIVTKVAYGGRPISRWVPDGKIYKELLKEAKAATADKKIDTVTFVWMQGERDHQEDATTQAYRKNLETLYNQLTEDFRRDDINWVIGRLSDARLGTANWDTIRKIQVDVATKHPRAAWIDTDDLNGPTNGVHCPPAGYKQMGTRFAEKATNLIKQTSIPEHGAKTELKSERDFQLYKEPLPPAPNGAWTAVVIPDTQTYTTLRKGREGNAQILDQMFEWMATNQEARNIQVAVHVGDMTSKNEAKEWEKIRGSYRKIDGVIPYAVCVGNHDEKPIQRTAHLDSYFKINDNPLNKKFFAASFEKDNLENAYYVMERNGQGFLFMALEFLPRNEVVAWANEIIRNHPDHRVFLTIHEYISEKSRLSNVDGLAIPEEPDKAAYLRSFPTESHNINCGVDIKKKLIDPNPNVEFLVCGHYGCQIINEGGAVVFDKQEIATAHRSDPRDNGVTFHAMLFNAQWMRTGGDGWILLLEFQPDNRTVHVRTYSPYLKAYRTGPEYDYVLSRSR